MSALSTILSNPSIDKGHVVGSVLDIVDKPPYVSKHPWRIVTSRIDILLMMLNENELLNDMDWYEIYNDICVPSFQHTNADVRSSASELVMGFYHYIGDPVRKEVLALRNVKPNIINKML